MRVLAGANCADLPAFVMDKYFGARATDRLRAPVARAICARCVVLQECRSEALNGPDPPVTGTIAGVPASQIHTARAWRRYEQGVTDRPPRHARPEWLPMTDATEEVERVRLQEDEC